MALPTPFNKPGAVQDHIYIKFTDERGRARLFRITNIDDVEDDVLQGTAQDAALDLSDLLTQYQAGLATFTGMKPSVIAQRLLSGDQPLEIKNRRFSQDVPAQFTMITEVPDQTPAYATTGVDVFGPSTGLPAAVGPKPLMVTVKGLDPVASAVMSGLEAETIPDSGTTKSLQTGSYGHFQWSDPPGQGGFFTGTPTTTTRVPGWYTILEPGVPQPSGHETSHCSYGGILASETGLHRLSIDSSGGTRIMFNGQIIFDDMTPSQFTEHIWLADLVAGTWYPFVVHECYRSQPRVVSLGWNTPGTFDPTNIHAGFTHSIPATNLTHQLFQGLLLARLVDSNGTIVYMTFYKHWNGRDLVQAYPIKAIYPAYVTDAFQLSVLWPKVMSPGTLIEELCFPTEEPIGRVNDWGSGWTRRAGPFNALEPPPLTTSMQGRARGY